MIRTAFISLFLVICASLFANAQIELKVTDTYETGVFDDGAAEIVAYDPFTRRVFVVNANSSEVDVLSIKNPYNIKTAKDIFGNTIVPINVSDVLANGGINSVDVKRGIVAVAVENADPCANGFVAFYNLRGKPINLFDGNTKNYLEVGNLPDAVKFSDNGRKIIVANEGEPCGGGIDPPGSISIIDLTSGLSSATVTTMGFAGVPIGPDVIIHPGKTPEEDLEPEFSAFSSDGTQAFVTLQEANAFAIVDVTGPSITQVVSLGFKDHDTANNGIDASDRDDAINIQRWPVYGMYMPDGIASYKVGGNQYYVTANEGDARDEDDRVKDLTLDPTVFPDAGTLQEDENLGRLEVSTILGDTDNDGDYDELYSYGSRSFTIWDANGNQVWDSGDDFEQITAAELPDYFNSTNDDNDSFDSRSDAKGPEPENVAIGRVGFKYYAFIVLERIGGVMVYNITNPNSPSFVQYINNRDFSVDAETSEAGDLGPEGIIFISAFKSPIFRPMVVVGNEVSGTTTVYRIKRSRRR